MSSVISVEYGSVTSRFVSKDDLPPQIRVRAARNVPRPEKNIFHPDVSGVLTSYLPGTRLRNPKKAATAGGRTGIDFWNIDSFV